MTDDFAALRAHVNGLPAEIRPHVYLSLSADTVCRLLDAADERDGLREFFDEAHARAERLRGYLDTERARAERLAAIASMLDAVVEGAQEEFVRVPYGASHEDVAQINDWHRMAKEARAALAESEQKT